MSSSMIEALIASLRSTDDAALVAAFTNAAPAELALAVRLLPIERGNTLLALVDPELAKASIELFADDAEPERRSVRRLLKRLHAAQRERHGLLLASLDALVRLLGRLRRETSG